MARQPTEGVLVARRREANEASVDASAASRSPNCGELYLVAMSLMVAFSGCGLVQFDVDQPLPEQLVQGNVLGGLLPSFIPNPLKVSIDVKAETQKRGTGPASAAFLKSLKFDATKNSGTFSFLDEVHIFIEAPNLAKREIARAMPMGSGGTSLPFEILPGENLLPFVNAGATLSATASGHAPARDFTFDGILVLDIRI